MREILKTKPFEIPTTELIPMNGRILCTTIPRLAREGSGKILQPTFFTIYDENGNPQTVEHKIYIAVVVAEDVNLFVEVDGQRRRIQRGDELVPMIAVDAVGWSLPIVHDFTSENKQEYVVLHESEAFAINVNPELVIEDLEGLDLKIEGDASPGKN